MIGVEPQAELGEWFDAADGAGSCGSGRCRSARPRPGRRRHPGAQPVPLVRPRLEGQRRAARTHGLDAASSFKWEDDVAGSIPCGDDVAVLEAAKAYADAGFTHLALLQIGDQQAPFLGGAETSLTGLAGRFC